ncbi:MAG: hypothetical protein ACREUQ_10225 [Burkholderiales bacterium]
MTVGVSHTHGGNVVVVDMDSGARWDMTPDMAELAAETCDRIGARDIDRGIVALNALEGRIFKYHGKPGDFRAMAQDLRHHAKEGRAKCQPAAR